MQAIVLAGGFGTRLAPLTYTRPKPLLPILNKPMIQHLVEALPKNTDVILATNYQTEKIGAYFESIGRPININEEPRPLGTGGATKFAEKYIEDTFLVLNSDIISSLNFRKFIKLHKEKRATATISLWPVDNVSEFGVADVQSDGRIIDFKEKPRREEAPSNLINAGAYCLEPEVLDYIPAEEMVSMEQEIFPHIIKEGKRFYGYPIDGFWIDVGRPQNYLDANLILLQRHNLNRVVGDGSHNGGTVEQSCVGNDCSIEKAAIIDSVLYDRVQVAKGAQLTRCIIGEGCSIETGAHLHNVVVGDDEVIPEGTELETRAVWTQAKPAGYPDKQIGNPVKED
jgi:mannose-1-phosphate guanylyltransferase